MSHISKSTPNKKMISEMYVLHVSPHHLMAWNIKTIFEQGCIHSIAAQAFTDLVRPHLVSPKRTLITLLAKISLLLVENEVVDGMVFAWLITKLVIVVSLII